MREESTGNALSGQSTLEVLVALAVLSLAIGAAIVLALGGRSTVLDSEEANKARALAREGIETAIADAAQSFESLGSSTSTIAEFTRTVTVSTVATNVKLVRVRVAWSTDALRTQSVDMDTLVTNWRQVTNTGGDDGGEDPSGDWRNPRTLGSVDLGPGNSATGLDVLNKYVYLSAEASAAAKPDFFIVNATNGQAPVITASLNTGPSTNAVDVAGGYAYLANASSTDQLQIVDVSSPLLPVLTASLTLPGVSGAGSVGNEVFYYGGRLYIGTQQTTGPEFHVVDVSTPSSPSALGSFEINGDVNAIYVSGATAYVATSNTTELKILDVTDPDSIVHVGSLDLSGGQDGLSLHVVGSLLYLGRAEGSSVNELTVLDITNPGGITTAGAANIGNDVTALYVRGDLAFLGVSDANKEFQVWGVTDPAAVSFWSSFNFPQVVTGIDYEDNLVYVSVRSNDALRIITSGP